MVLELEGRTLREVLATEGALAWPRAVGIVQQLARALAAAHEHAPVSVHCALKPENVSLHADGSLKVTDFGVAQRLVALGPASTHSASTLAYLSPEQIDAGPIDARSELYALGLVFYELIAGKPPFESSSLRELLNLQCTAAPPPFVPEIRRELPHGVERLVFALLEKAPARRPAAAADVLRALEPFAPSAASGDAPSSVVAASVEAAPAVRSVPPTHTKLGTSACIERATDAPTVSWSRTVAVIVACSLLSGLATYAVRCVGRAEAPHASRSVR